MSFSEEQNKLSECLRRLTSAPVSKVLDDTEFQYFNKWRNKFNDRQVHKLIQQAPYNPAAPKFKDQMGRLWKEVVIGTKFHTDKWSLNPYTILVDKGQTLRKWGKEKKNRFSRKFIMEAPIPGYVGAEYEMVIGRSGNRLHSGDKMETFNFGPTGLISTSPGVSVRGTQILEAGLHFKFDVAPHQKFGFQEYMCYPAPPVRIVDFVDLLANDELDLKNMFKSFF